MAKVSIVLGLGFGDEGKGVTVAHLVSHSKLPLVIRFNGGHQAGHTVVKDGVKHIHSTYGSGALYGAPTYVSEFCTFDPLAAHNEWKELKRKGVTPPRLIIHPDCPVVTPWDGEVQRIYAAHYNHGTVGVGFGYTLNRHFDNHYRLCARDLRYPNVLLTKLKLIYNSYGAGAALTPLEEVLAAFYDSDVDGFYKVGLPDADKYEHHIYEGAQGIMLDQDFGYFPHVTRSFCTSRNAMEMLTTDPHKAEIYLVTRAYATRHGAGPLIHEEKGKDLQLVNTDGETNVSHPYQGEFRKAPLSVNQLKYAIECEQSITYTMVDRKQYRLVVTCLDQVGGYIPDVNGEEVTPQKLSRELGFKSVLANFSPEGQFVEYEHS